MGMLSSLCCMSNLSSLVIGTSEHRLTTLRICITTDNRMTGSAGAEEGGVPSLILYRGTYIHQSISMVLCKGTGLGRTW